MVIANVRQVAFKIRHVSATVPALDGVSYVTYLSKGGAYAQASQRNDSTNEPECGIYWVRLWRNTDPQTF